MINVEKINGEDIQCAICMKKYRNTDIYQIKTYKTKLKLCHECFMDLGNQIYEIYQEATDFID